MAVKSVNYQRTKINTGWTCTVCKKNYRPGMATIWKRISDGKWVCVWCVQEEEK